MRMSVFLSILPLSVLAATCETVLPVALAGNGSSASAAFSLGADVSWITEMELKGLTLCDREGRTNDCFALMKDFGLTAVRLRVWVDPSKHGGWCDAKDVLSKALRARRAGHEIMIDFHYSDWWADPGKQDMPASWRGLGRDAVIKALARHTEYVLTMLKTNNVPVKWVQVGNETDHGILWAPKRGKDGKTVYVRRPDGRWTPEMMEDSFADRYRHPQNYADCFKAGYAAVKKVYPQAIVILHHAEGCNVSSTDDHLATLAKHGAKWDMLGISLYPYHSRYRNPVEQKTIEESLATLRHVAEKWQCDTMVVETGFECIPAKYEEGRSRLADIIRRARTIPRCRGVFYWEPQCRPTYHHYPLGAFDDQGRPTPIMDGFKIFTRPLAGETIERKQ